MTTVTLHHRWRGRAELHALALVADALAPAGLRWTDTPADDGIELVKMHGRELMAAMRQPPGLVDLRRVADAAAWWSRVFPCVLEAMQGEGGVVHGIPMGVHRSNAVWVHGARAQALGADVPADIEAWEGWLERAQAQRPHPLAVNAEAWPLCLLFENLVLGSEGPAFHRAAFEGGDGSALGSPAMRRLLERFMAWRRFVADESLAATRAQLVQQLRAGEVACMVMGDWVRKEFAAWGAAGHDTVREWPTPGTARRFLYNVDYFVPVERGTVATNAEALHTLAGVLLSPGLQQAFSAVKGSLPAVRDARPARDDAGWALLRDSPASPEAMVPSFTFDHCCDVARRAAIADALADGFLGRATVDATLARLVAAPRIERDTRASLVG